MCILITGANGFIGSHLLPELEAHGHDVRGVDREDGDLRDDGVCERLVEPGTEIVVHLAARVGHTLCEDDPAGTVEVNAIGTLRLASACAERRVRLVYVSTSEVYGSNGEAVCDEVDGPFTPPANVYGLSKLHGEQLAKLYAPRGLTILRLSMPYGPGLPWGHGRAALVNMLWQARTGQRIPVHRGAERSWCWIADTVAGIRLAIERSAGGVFNIGRDDDPRSMEDVARLACDLTGASYSLIELVDAPAGQIVVKRLATRRLRALGWNPEVGLEDGMRRTLDWIDRRLAGEQVAA